MKLSELSHLEATERGGALVKKCRAAWPDVGEWRARVWENMGWHYAACSPLIKVCEDQQHFTAYLGGAPGNLIGGTWAASGKTIRDAIVATIEEAYASIDPALAVLAVVDPDGRYRAIRRRAQRKAKS